MAAPTTRQVYKFGTSGYRDNTEEGFNEAVVTQIAHAMSDYLIGEMERSGKAKPLLIGGDVNTAHTEIDLARPGPNSKVSGFLPQERAWLKPRFSAASRSSRSKCRSTGPSRSPVRATRSPRSSGAASSTVFKCRSVRWRESRR